MSLSQFIYQATLGLDYQRQDRDFFIDLKLAHKFRSLSTKTTQDFTHSILRIADSAKVKPF